MIKNWIILLLGMLFISSCDEVPKLSSISKIATSFSTGNQNFNNGVLIVGLRTDAPGKISYSSPDGNFSNITLERGDWVFYGVGYSDATTNEKFSGTKHCGTAVVNIRGGKSTTVDLNLSVEGCSGKLSRDLKFKDITFRSCSSFYKYDSTTNLFNDIDPENVNDLCSGPLEQTHSIGYFKLSSLNINDQISSPGFSSSCHPINSLLAELPSDVMPLIVSFYRSYRECEANMVPHNSFQFKDGISVGDSANFDHFFKEYASETRLSLPEAHTKRFKSPFMNMIPRFLCDKGDCVPEPLLDRHIQVGWRGNLNQMLDKNISDISCSADLLKDSKYFGIRDCYVKNRTLYASLLRNSYTCQSTTNNQNITDMYERNGNIYVLRQTGSSSYIYVDSKNGVRIDSFAISNDISFRHLAATETGIIYLLAPNKVLKIQKDASGNYVPTKEYTLSDGKNIEVSPDGKFIFLVDGTKVISYVITDIDKGNYSPMGSVSIANEITHMQYTNGKLFYLEHNNSNKDGNFVELTVDANGTFSNMDNDVNSGVYSFYVDTETSTPYLLGSGTNAGKVFGGGKSYSHTFTSAKHYIISGANHILSDGVSLYVYRLDGTSAAPNFTQISLHNSECSEDVSIGLVAPKTLRLRTVLNPVSNDINPWLFENGLELTGKRSFNDLDKPFYYFRFLHEEQQRFTTGGKLSLVQRLLGPAGLGGMLHDYKECSDIVSAVNLLPSGLTRYFSVSDPYNGYRSYEIKISNDNSMMPDIICDDSTHTPSICSSKYQLNIIVKSTGMLENENYNLKLSCNSKAGDLDFLKYDNTLRHKERYLWNTNSDLSSRAEIYRSYNGRHFNRSEVSIIMKSKTKDLWGRIVSMTKYPSGWAGQVREFERNAAAIYSRQEMIEGSPDHFMSAGNATIRTNLSFTGMAAQICAPENTTSITFTSTAGCQISSYIPNTSMGIDPSLEALSTADDSNDLFQTIFQTTP